MTLLEDLQLSPSDLWERIGKYKEQTMTLQFKLDKAVKVLEDARERIGEIPTENFEEVSLLCQNIEKALAEIKGET